MDSPEIVHLQNILLQGNYGSDVTHSLTEVNKSLLELKENLASSIKNNRINLKRYQNDNQTLTRKIFELDKLMITADERNNELIEIAAQCRSEIYDLSASLEEVNLTSDIVSRLISINVDIENVRSNIAKKMFYEAAQIIVRVLDNIINGDDLENLKYYTNFQSESVLLREQILFDIAQFWDEYIVFDLDTFDKDRIVTVSIDFNKIDVIEDVAKTAYLMKDSLLERRLFRKVKNHILLQTITNSCDVLINTNDKARLTFKVFTQKEKPSYLSVFENLKSILGYFKAFLNVSLPDGGDLMAHFGEHSAQEVISVLMKDCLSEAIPSEPGQIGIFNGLLDDTAKLQTYLQTIGFLPIGSMTLSDYCNDVHGLFANRIYLSYLDRAREIMKKDLHTITISEDINLPNRNLFPTPIRKVVLQHLNLTDEKHILMGKCQISKSALEILKLASTIFQEVKDSDELRGIRLIRTIRNIFEMYAAVVPVHHKKLLETIPQQVAIFHNNCLHLAFRLILMASDSLLENSIKDQYHILLDEAYSMRTLGVNYLENCVSNQRSQLIYILRDSGLGTLNETPKLDPTAEKATRQCIRQLQLLRNVWVDILPPNVFSNVMGFLVDAFTEEVVNLVLGAEDISSQTASELVNMFKVAQERLPALLTDLREVYRLCRKWSRFVELIFILESNLGSIRARWAGGAGPLANDFTPDEVKHLIRALFQNTEQRAALLAQIK